MHYRERGALRRLSQRAEMCYNVCVYSIHVDPELKVGRLLISYDYFLR